MTCLLEKLIGRFVRIEELDAASCVDSVCFESKEKELAENEPMIDITM